METTRVDGSVWGRTIPIAILVNEQTGAGGEEVAATLRETGVGYLIGKHTFGALAGGRNYPLQNGSTLQIAVAACRSGQGQEIEHKGLEPDLTVELDPAMLAEGMDAQLEAALSYLREKAGL
jgi:C-terminal processing protease CtpA/Prc